MKRKRAYSLVKILLLTAAASLLVLWIGLHAKLFFTTQNGAIRTILSLTFSFLILLRPKPENMSETKSIPLPAILFALVCGTCAATAGIVLSISQLEWIGILILLFAIFEWTLPASFKKDIPLAVFVLYWIAPMPSQIFGPLQIIMQQASVAGSEWLLQVFNVRVWGDGLVLRTGVYIFEVPVWCSGMRTATTVFILSLALGILRRLRFLEIFFFIIWSLLHALLLNIIRICIMIAFAPHTHSDKGLDFLHDSAGIVVIGGVLAVYMEMLYFENRRRRQRQRQTEINQVHFENISEYPPFWKRIVKNRKQMIWAAVTASLIVTLAIRSRPYHRAMMIGDVVTELRDHGDMENAMRGALVVSAMIPDDIDWKFTTIRLKMISGHHLQVISELEAMHDLPQQYQTAKKILTAYSLMYLGRIDEAAAIVRQLPDEMRNNDPRVAMIMAEMALKSNDSDAVAAHVVTASGWAPNAGRIRNLYPYLHVHRQWKAMIKSDIKIPYYDPIQAFSILEAYMNLGETPRVADITMQVTASWPTDMRALEPLYFMALSHGNEAWQKRFSDHLMRATAVCDNPDILYETMYKCFSLSRPDLAWVIYERIREIDPQHPTLYMCAAKYGNKWFKFRKRHIGIPATFPEETVDLRPFYILGQFLPKWHKTLDAIPYARELCVENTTPPRKQFLKKAIKSFETKAASEAGLSPDMQYLYVQALEMGARVDLAKQELQKISTEHPDQKKSVRIMLSEIYERKGNWINVYESLRTYLNQGYSENSESNVTALLTTSWPPVATVSTSADSIHLKPLLRLIKAQLKLKMRLAALHTARETIRLFPYSAQAIKLLAQAQLELGDAEAALSLLQQPRMRSIKSLNIIEVEALLKTQRFSEISPFCRRSILPQIRIASTTIQDTSLPPAELSLLWHRVSIPSEEQFRKNAIQLQHNLSSAGPGLRKLLTLWLNAYQQHCDKGSAAQELWLAAGRDPTERATAMNMLTILLCRDEYYKAAESAARAAVTALPNEPLLWQILISLSEAPAETVAASRKLCPDSPELWLAELVTKTHSANSTNTPLVSSIDEKWLTASIKEAIEKKFPPATLTRAGEYLCRNNMPTAAIPLARDVTERARGLLPAYIFAMHCALYEKDEKWALECTKHAIDSALNPLPEFYKNLVKLKTSGGKIDIEPDMVNALHNLRQTDPDNPDWAQMLGYIRFKRGGWEIVDAMTQMQAAINNGATNSIPYLIASEASRLLHNYDRAADILRQGLKHNPNSAILINNLAYTLSYSPKSIDEAVALIPRLQQLSQDNPQIKDTIATIHLRKGNLDASRKAIASILKTTVPGSPAWFRAKMHLAEIASQRGQKNEAVAILTGLLKNLNGISDEDIMMANSLLTQIKTPKIKHAIEEDTNP